MTGVTRTTSVGVAALLLVAGVGVSTAVAVDPAPVYTGTITQAYLDAQPEQTLAIIGTLPTDPRALKDADPIGWYMAKGLQSARLVWAAKTSAPWGASGSCRPSVRLNGEEADSGPELPCVWHRPRGGASPEADLGVGSWHLESWGTTMRATTAAVATSAVLGTLVAASPASGADDCVMTGSLNNARLSGLARAVCLDGGIFGKEEATLWLPQRGSDGYEYMTSGGAQWMVGSAANLPQSLICAQVIALDRVRISSAQPVDMSYPGLAPTPGGTPLLARAARCFGG